MFSVVFLSVYRWRVCGVCFWVVLSGCVAVWFDLGVRHSRFFVWFYTVSGFWVMRWRVLSWGACFGLVCPVLSVSGGIFVLVACCLCVCRRLLSCCCVDLGAWVYVLAG